MRKSKEWGGELELIAMCRAASLRILLYRMGEPEPVAYECLEEPLRLARLAYFTHEDFDHYVSVRRLGCDEGSAFEKINDPAWHDRELVERLQAHRIADSDEEAPADQKQEEPFPGLSKKKKCKCGSKLAYQDCCLKQFLKRQQGEFR
jgi:hypothetical protein